MRYFNTAGPVNPEIHYYVKNRLDENELNMLVAHRKYFALHGPRQSGKTTALMEFAKHLNDRGEYKVLYINIESVQVARNNVERAMLGILQIILVAIQEYLVPEEEQKAIAYLENILQGHINVSSLEAFLTYWSCNSSKPIVVFIDEIDSLVGDSLVAVLRQLRAGYVRRPKRFPSTVCLIGVRDVRDYRIWSPEHNDMVLGGSAFNIKAESLALPDFNFDQVVNLYDQHTAETGQKFTDEAIQYVFYVTQGQPWLVNALAYQACFRDITDRSVEITKEVIERAKEVLINRRDTHIDVLVDKLMEPRVRVIIDAILEGNDSSEAFPLDDINYARDMGLLARNGKNLLIANPMYQEIIPRELTYTTQLNMRQEYSWYQNSDGTLNMNKVLEAFKRFYYEHSEMWLEKFEYKESGPKLLLTAFLQSVIDGFCTIHHEYALGKKRMDLLVCGPHDQKVVVELKILRGHKTLSEGLISTAHYMESVNATEGYLVIFDRDGENMLEDTVSSKQELYNNKHINVWIIDSPLRRRRYE